MTTQPESVRVEDRAPPRALRRRVAEVLAAGRIVALPTETVYGLAARADDPAALERLRRLKGRPDELHFTWHVTERAAVNAARELRPLARRLAARYWPGPLTLVLQAAAPGLEAVAAGGWLGMRLPAHKATLALLEALDFPVVMTSANRHGARPLVDADAVRAELGEELELVVDGGPSRLGEASAVLRLGAGHFELLRPGLFRLDELRATAGRRIGFVCTGNTCRSPMAEGLARQLVARRLDVPPERIGDFGFELRSMGVFAAAGSPAARHAIDVMREHEIDLSGHVSSPALPEVVAGLDEVYALTRSHRDALTAALPPGKARHVRLLDPLGRDVPDPIGGSREDYRRCAEAIAEALRARVEDWA